MRANLWLRSASRVVVRVAEFRATAFFELEKHAKRIDWSPYLGPGLAPEFRVTAKKSKLYHSDAIAERLLSAVGPRVSGKQKAEDRLQLFVVRMHRDICTISADASGELLHMRGYRQAVAKAPLRETLAAAMLIANDWTGTESLLDPFCGSGTIPIEAALMARGMAPGMNREFAFERWPAFDRREWKSLKDDARSRMRESTAVIQSQCRARRRRRCDRLSGEVAICGRATRAKRARRHESAVRQAGQRRQRRSQPLCSARQMDAQPAGLAVVAPFSGRSDGQTARSPTPAAAPDFEWGDPREAALQCPLLALRLARLSACLSP
jgi:hypothetical protein